MFKIFRSGKAVKKTISPSATETENDAKAPPPRWLSRLWSDLNGNFGTFTALLIIPLLGAAGLSIDIAHVLSVRSYLQQAADAAALDAVSATNLQKVLSNSAGKDVLAQQAEEKAKRVFYQELTKMNLTDVKIDLFPAITVKDHQVQMTMKFSAQVPTSFMRALGYHTVGASGVVTADSLTPRYTDLHLLVDNSPSMGIGATQAAMTMMRAVTTTMPGFDEGCEFACHVPGDEDTYSVVRAANIPMRIDVVQKAIAKLADAVEKTRIVPNQYKMSLHTLGANGATHLQSFITALGTATADMTIFRSNAEKIDLMYMPDPKFNDRISTYMPSALDEMNKIIPLPGDASSPGRAEQLLILISDGLSHSVRKGCKKPVWTITDENNRVSQRHCQEPIDPANCTTIKKRGIRIATLYTTYLPLPDNFWYAATIAPWQKDIALGMKNCASPGLYFEVGFEDSMEDALRALFVTATSGPRLTQ